MPLSLRPSIQCPWSLVLDGTGRRGNPCSSHLHAADGKSLPLVAATLSSGPSTNTFPTRRPVPFFLFSFWHSGTFFPGARHGQRQVHGHLPCLPRRLLVLMVDAGRLLRPFPAAQTQTVRHRIRTPLLLVHLLRRPCLACLACRWMDELYPGSRQARATHSLGPSLSSALSLRSVLRATFK